MAMSPIKPFQLTWGVEVRAGFQQCRRHTCSATKGTHGARAPLRATTPDLACCVAGPGDCACGTAVSRLARATHSSRCLASSTWSTGSWPRGAPSQFSGSPNQLQPPGCASGCRTGELSGNRTASTSTSSSEMPALASAPAAPLLRTAARASSPTTIERSSSPKGVPLRAVPRPTGMSCGLGLGGSRELWAPRPSGRNASMCTTAWNVLAEDMGDPQPGRSVFFCHGGPVLSLTHRASSRKLRHAEPTLRNAATAAS
mmetsp:Transcript_3223/g.10413  ORF Transcript_3223/g.10413 Transcript_3223/m.10413 type:complete len:257 (+) Transcript_3223:69-839(+)